MSYMVVVSFSEVSSTYLMFKSSSRELLTLSFAKANTGLDRVSRFHVKSSIGLSD